MPSHHQSDSGAARPFWSRPCLAGTHVDCGHLGAIGHGFRNGGRLSLLVCQCRCHSACLLAGRLHVSRAIWEGLCTCPGEELAADKLDAAERDAPDFGDFERQWRERREGSARESEQRRRAKRDAFEATRAARVGKSRAQIREIYVAELRTRGLTVPSDLVLDATADAIARNRDKFTAVYSARVLAQLGWDFRKLFSDFGP